jgi:hypothetical protein
MTSAVQICSNASLMLGGQTISDFNDAQESDRGRLAANLYGPARDYVLRSHPWNCATKRVILNPLAEPPAFDYDYQFQLPGDWIRTLQVGYRGCEMDYKHEGRVLVANENVMPLRYIWRNENEASWDRLLVWAMTNVMRAIFANPMTSSTSLEQLVWQELQPLLQQARSIDGQDDPPDELGDYPLLQARYQGLRRPGGY